LIIAWVVVLGWTSCASEEEGTAARGLGKDVLFKVSIPNAGAPQTRALTTGDESSVVNAQVLLFVADKYKETRLVESAEISLAGNNCTFNVKLPAATYSNLVILSNARSILDAAGLATTDTKAQVYQKLKTAVATAELPATSGATKLAMWGEYGAVTVNASTTTIPATGTLPSIRMNAKLNVSVAAGAQSKFQLQSVYVYNANTSGLLVPGTAGANWDVTTPAAPFAKKPTLPAGVAKYADPLEYTVSEAAKWAYANEIYLYEADNTSGALDAATRPCLVLGGSYDGSPTTTYYRVDLARTVSNVTTYLDVLRNHSYSVSVEKVSGPGYSTKEDAFSAKPVNILAGIITWDDALTNGVWDGQYRLCVSHIAYRWSKEVRNAGSADNKLIVQTDFPGWTVDSNAEWLSVATASM
jgi:hypothetical protein